MTNPKIVGTLSNEAMFSVAFPNGLDGEPHITANYLSIEADGESAVYAMLLACADWLVNHVDEMKAKPQVEYNIDDISGKHVRCKDGVVTDISEQSTIIVNYEMAGKSGKFELSHFND